MPVTTNAGFIGVTLRPDCVQCMKTSHRRSLTVFSLQSRRTGLCRVCCDLLASVSSRCVLLMLTVSSVSLPLRTVQTLADKSKQEALKNDLMEALKRKHQS